LNGVFLFNQYHSNEVKNTYVVTLFKSWFGFEMTGRQDSNIMMSPIFQRSLNDEEMATFEFDFSYFSNPITVGLRMESKNIIYHSKDYKRVGPRRCNYVVRFKGESLVNYGIIKYFLEINGAICLALNELLIIENLTDKIKGRACVALTNLKRSGALNRFFSVAKLNDRLIFISPSEILNKCVISQESNGFFKISQFDLENDYN
jgi:hypothetical protein